MKAYFVNEAIKLRRLERENGFEIEALVPVSWSWIEWIICNELLAFFPAFPILQEP